MDGSIDFLISALTEFKTYGPAAQLGTLITLICALSGSYWVLRQRWRDNQSKYALEVEEHRRNADAAERAMKDLQAQVAKAMPVSAEYVEETIPKDLDDGNTGRAVKIAEDYLTHHRDAMHAANQLLQTHYLARYEDGLSGLRRARTYTFGWLACEPGSSRAREELDLIEAQLRIDAAPPENKAEEKRREEETWLRSKLKNNPDDLNTLMEVARYLFRRGNYRWLETVWRRAESVCTGPTGPGRDTPEHLRIRHETANAISFTGRYWEAEKALLELLPVMARIQGPEHPDTLTARFTIAQAQLNQGKAAEVEAALTELLPLYEKVRGPEHPDRLTTRFTIAEAQLNQGKAAEAEAALTELLPLYEKVQGPEHPHVLTRRRLLCLAYLELGKADAAQCILAPLPEDGGDVSPLRIGKTQLLRAFLADLEGRAEDAEAHLDRADQAITHLAPEYPTPLELACYRRTRVPGGAGGTTLWMVQDGFVPPG